MLITGAARCVWIGLIVWAGPSTAGLALIIGADLGLLLCTGLNSAFATYRMQVTADQHLARAAATWAITGKVAQPIGIAAAGPVTAAVGVRAAIGGIAIVLVASIVLLPWGTPQPADEAVAITPKA
jgi:hypothetical protein